MLVHVTGASGSGTTTLGRVLAEKHGFQYLDSDDYYWLPTDPPYHQARPLEERQKLMAADLKRGKQQVITGSFVGWGDVFVPRLSLVAFLYVPAPERIRRLRQRELAAFGWERLRPGGAMHENHEAFLQWAASYDTGGVNMRSLARHEAWLAGLSCPVLRLDGTKASEQLAQEVLGALGALIP